MTGDPDLDRALRDIGVTVLSAEDFVLQRSAADVKVESVLRVPGVIGTTDLSQVLACERCGVVPTFDPSPMDPRVPIELQLKMVSSPDRARSIFLGPKCVEVEISRYLSRAPVE